MLPPPTVDKIKRKYQRYESWVLINWNQAAFPQEAKRDALAVRLLNILDTCSQKQKLTVFVFFFRNFFSFFYWKDMEGLCLGDTRAASHCVKAVLKLHTRLLHTRSPLILSQSSLSTLVKPPRWFFSVLKVSKWSKKCWPCSVFHLSVIQCHAPHSSCNLPPQETGGGIRQE